MNLIPNGKVHGANMGPTWVLSTPDGPYVGPMHLAIRVVIAENKSCIRLVVCEHMGILPQIIQKL